MNTLSAIAIAAHPDDIEFMMAGTLLLLREAGWKIHTLNLASGSCGSSKHRAAALRRIRRGEARAAAAVIGAKLHESCADDLELTYSVPLLRRVTAVIRDVQPTIVLTHSPQDYMEDHTVTCRLAVTAAFARGIPNFNSKPARPAWIGSTTVYHAMPHGLVDQLRHRIVPGAFVETTSVQKKKLSALACHQSQQDWLRLSQDMNSYLREMQEGDRTLGRMSRRFEYAEGWRRHSHMGFCNTEADPLRDALGRKYLQNRAYEKGLASG